MSARAVIATWIMTHQDEDAFTAGEEIVKALEAAGYVICESQLPTFGGLGEDYCEQCLGPCMRRPRHGEFNI